MVFLFPIWLFSFELCHDRIFTFEMHHRFSEPVKSWSKSTRRLPHLPVEGTFEYHAVLAHRDRLFGGRILADFKGPFAFSDGNSTYRISSLGFLHYTTVQLGTPGVKFMVTLDTGSDLFWVPLVVVGTLNKANLLWQDFELNVYNPRGSSTSRRVPCISSLCAHRNCCLGTFSNCPYEVSYISAQIATSGILVEAVLHLRIEDSHQESVKAYVTFGCGQAQSGSFLDVAAPNGLFGLGMEKISVPSILSQEGLTADSFSMCFGHDGIGRISFGDKGSPDKNETPFNLNPSCPTYNISATQIRVGTALIDSEFTALWCSCWGMHPAYHFGHIALGAWVYCFFVPWGEASPGVEPKVSFKRLSQACDKQHSPDSRIPFEYCYDMSPDTNASLTPSMSLTMKGGGLFAIYDPIIVISTKSQLVYCLAIIKSTEMNIIGQNFLTGHRVVFDREKLVLGGKKFDCKHCFASYAYFSSMLSYDGLNNL
ncbi:hypothetical protein SLEP1_g52226 [Rubroshorea leprosula]|uniref:Peptidase A1 domain-containing protein n=1 Tax=Rubroshorea leprosula TaxID=152421 RepID=A0AAV5M6E7_9ROSI|nr:hypothetical protein SLEP1_g52226 [Rubroshorea leprosula]